MSESLYKTDFYAWAQQQAQALQEKDWAAVDLGHLVEEVQGLAGTERRTIVHELERLILHLLKWHNQPSARLWYGDSWLTSIDQARHHIALVIEESHSLHDYPAQRFCGAHRYARRQAARQTKLPQTTFPDVCPWALEDVLREEWLPPDAENPRR